jgi:hypothetical protein
MKSIREILDGPFAPWLGGDDWRPWSAFLCALRGEPMSDYEADLFRRCTGRTTLPSKPFREAWVCVGRKGRKSATAAQLAVYAAVYGTWKRAPGETLRVVVIALSKDQAALVTDYAAAILASRPGLARLVTARDSESIKLSTGVEIACFPNSFRLVRGPTIVCAILDEVAIWWNNELAANPDREVLRALKPAMITQPDSLLIGLSSPFAKRGLLYEKHRDHYGRDDSSVLVWQADTTTMNPQVDRAEIEQAYRDDPLSAAAEFGASFRSDLETYVSAEVIRDCVDDGVYERLPVDHTRYFSFCDPASGSGTDSMTLAIAHRQKEDSNTIVLDAVREWRPPFNPSDVIGEATALLQSYKCAKTHGDRFGGEWCRQQFRDAGVAYEVSDKAKNDLYTNFLPLLNSGRVRLLDHQRLIGQLASLERTTTRGTGRAVVDHPRGAHDDVANATAGVIGLAKRGAYLSDLSWVSDTPDEVAAREFQQARFNHHVMYYGGYSLRRRYGW